MSLHYWAIKDKATGAQLNVQSISILDVSSPYSTSAISKSISSGRAVVNGYPYIPLGPSLTFYPIWYKIRVTTNPSVPHNIDLHGCFFYGAYSQWRTVKVDATKIVSVDSSQLGNVEDTWTFSSYVQRLSGRVYVSYGKEVDLYLQGVKVQDLGTGHYTYTNSQGAYELSVPTGTRSIRFTKIGYTTKTLSKSVSTGIYATLDCVTETAGGGSGK